MTSYITLYIRTYIRTYTSIYNTISAIHKHHTVPAHLCIQNPPMEVGCNVFSGVVKEEGRAEVLQGLLRMSPIRRTTSVCTCICIQYIRTYIHTHTHTHTHKFPHLLMRHPLRKNGS